MDSGKQHIAIGIITTVCRFVLAVVFIFSGFVKAIDPLGTQYKIQDYLDAFGWTGVYLSLLLSCWECWNFVWESICFLVSEELSLHELLWLLWLS